MSEKQLGDKILGAHNNPTRDFSEENFTVNKQDSIDEFYNEEEYLYKKGLEDSVWESFNQTRWKTLTLKKKIPKDLLPHIFQDVLENIGDSEYSLSERFVTLCDFINTDYTKGYEVLPIKYRERIISELENKYSILSKKNIKKLF